MSTRNDDSALERFIRELDAQETRWWQNFANEQDWRGTIGEAIDPWRFPVRETDLAETVARAKRSIAQRLLIAVRAALAAGLVDLPKNEATEGDIS